MAKRGNNNRSGDRFPKKDRPDARGVQGRREREIDDTIAKLGKCNDPAWYRQYPSVVETSANIPFANPAGRATSLDTTLGDFSYTAPGIMTFEWVPTFGYSADKRSPLNIAFLRLYERMRSELQGSISSLEYADIAMYTMAVDSLYCLHRFARMVYGLINAYSVQNWYFPRGMVEALGLNIDDLVSAGPNFRYYLDQMAIMLGHLYLPGGSEELTIFKRHAWLCENYFLDSGTARAQVYLPKIVGLYKFNNTVTTGSQLELQNVWGSLPTTGQAKYLYDVFMDLYNALAGDEDTGNISGFMARVFGNQMEAPLTPDNFMVTPTFSDEVLSQIENMKYSYLGPSNYASFNITQNPSVNNGAIICTPSIAVTEFNGFSGDILLNFHKMNPTPDDVMVATRLSSVYEVQDKTLKIVGLGTEYVSRVVYWVFDGSGTLTPFTWTQSNALIDSTNATQLAQYMRESLVHSQFDWAPMHLIMMQAGADGAISLAGVMADLDVFTTIQSDLLKQLHNVAVQSELYVKLR